MVFPLAGSRRLGSTAGYTVIDDLGFEWLMIDASYIKVHPHGTGAREGNQAIDRMKGGLKSKLHLAVDSHGIPVRWA